VRSFVRRTLDEWHIVDRADDVLLCLSELASNAVRHGVPDGQHFLVKVASADGRLRIEVHDTGRHRPRARQPGEDDTTGRGLLIVQTLADEWGVSRRGPRRKVVWIAFKIETQATTSPGPNPW
jgi:serine/threonine-protein kinase RsbW